MNWSKIKSVIILILLLGNIILAYTIISRYLNINYISEESLVTLRDILEDYGVQFDLSIIDRKKPNLYIYEASKDTEYQTKVASELSRSNIAVSFPSPAGSVIIMENGNKYEFENGFSFTYVKSQDDSEYYMSIFDSINDYAGTTDGKYTEMKYTDDLKKIIWDFISKSPSSHEDISELGKRGIRISRTIFDSEEKCYILSATQTLDEAEISGATVIFIIKQGENEVAAVKGTWYFIQPQKRYSSQLYDQLNILFNEKKRMDSGNSEISYDELDEGILQSQIFSKPEETVEIITETSGTVPVIEDKNIKESGEIVVITSLKLCYCLYQSQGSDGIHIFFIPGWEIIRENGSFTIYNGTDGKVYTNIE